ncbi:MAG: hypothetical protein QOI62_3027 [Solirubrobacteraceae bacterium]|jgi:4-azaleucine resistance transporter AzlC|nr:hypothetical protein [Solirubrobacteraceae bacterium]MEA2359767.1 hypothetical protein [Solirubrobacteraceae bacterium]
MRVGLPLALPMVLIGASFGVVAARAGWGAVATITMSLLTFAGAAQVVVVSVLAAGGSVVAAVVGGMLVNARFLAVGIAIGPHLRGGVVRRALLGQAITDAALVLARLGAGGYGVRRMLGSAAPQWLGWQAGTVLGVLVAPAIHDPARYGIDSLFPAFFLIMLMRELRTRPSQATAVLAGAIALAALPVAAPGVPVIVACAAVVVGVVWR